MFEQVIHHYTDQVPLPQKFIVERRCVRVDNQNSSKKGAEESWSVSLQGHGSVGMYLLNNRCMLWRLVVTGLSLLAHGSHMHDVLFTLLTQPSSVQKNTFREHEGPRTEVAFTCDVPDAWIYPVELALH